MSNTEATQPKAKKITGIVLNVLLWIFLVFAFLMMVFAFASQSNDYNVPIMGNKVILTVATDSMEPTVKQGDLIVGTVLTPEEKTSLKEGDIITFFVDLNDDGQKELNTHRITVVNYEGKVGVYKTKGDNNLSEDGGKVYANEIVSIWHEGDTQLHGVGSVFGFLQSRLGFMCIVVIPLALFFIYEVVRLILIVFKIKNGDKRSITAEDEEEIRRRAVEEYIKAQGGNPAAVETPAKDVQAEVPKEDTTEE